ncbi:hypothetical protein JCM8547_008531 [Rhodosporidiobolus lusitaniae]
MSCANCRALGMVCGVDVGCESFETTGVPCSSSKAPIDEPSPQRPAVRRIEAVERRNDRSASSLPALRLSLVPSGTETRLADLDTGGVLGASLLVLFNATGDFYPLPAYDFFALEKRFNRSGQRLSSMSISDQATCRILFALSSSLNTDHAIADPSILSQQLAEQAQSFADLVGVSCTPTLDNIVDLLLLCQLVCNGEIGSDAGQPFFAAVVELLSQLHETDPASLLSPSRGFCTGLVCHAAIYDTAAALERGTKPNFTPQAYTRLFGSVDLSIIPLPPLKNIEAALRSGPWESVQAVISAIASYGVAARHLAYFLAALGEAALGEDDLIELEEIWEVFERAAKWGSDVCRKAAEPGVIDFDAGIFSAPSTVNPLLSFTGTLWSISSLVAFAELFCSSHAWDRELHPGGPGDKLASLNFLITTLSKAVSLYRPTSDAATVTLQALEMDRVAIKSMLGLGSLANPSSSRFSPPPPTSLSEICNWLHRLDVNPPDLSSSSPIPPFSLQPAARSAATPRAPPYFSSSAEDEDATGSSLIPFPLPLPQSFSLRRSFPPSSVFSPSPSARPSAFSSPVQTIPSPSFPFSGSSEA